MSNIYQTFVIVLQLSVNMLCLGHVMSEMKKTFSIPEETETRLWSKFINNSKEILSNLDQTVQDTGIFPVGQV